MGKIIGIDLGTTNSCVAVMLQTFEEHGWIKTAPSPEDRRCQFLSLTAKGHQVFNPLERRSSEEVAAMLARLSPHQQKKMLAAIHDIEFVLGPPQPTAPQYILRQHRPGDMTVDCDVHQGNGTAAIFAGTRTASALLPSSSVSTVEHPKNAPRGKMRGAHAGDVFTISLHQHNNYPLWKPPSSIDVDLPDGCGDDDYLAWLDNALSSGLRQFEPDLICYIAGADPYMEDQLGGLNLSIEGLKKRDELVFRVTRARNIPVMVTFAGGYAQSIEATVTIHSNTVIAAREVFKQL